VRTKNVEKTYGDLWDQSSILEAVIGNTYDKEGLWHYTTRLPNQTSSRVVKLTEECGDQFIR